MAYIIRPFADRDAPALSDLTLSAIRSVGSKSYTPKQVTAWSDRHPGARRFLDRAAAGHHIIVAADSGDNAVAYSLLESDGHLDMLYCHPDHTRRGLADELLAASEQHARANAMSQLYTEASELARPAFERAGYIVQHRRDFDIPHAGGAVAIHNYAMEKPLN
ncbi:GNAT family N-acetyltransferase [Erythrobacter crassostreae]|uniref:GNAT family N-acetyltransferase n=1 Tax=Erythrobacter crassostreae TaxID=2828328 RepID=A0A9X1F4D9_9SPHN|nr:GNAT family N-acetyltransferase [Erythrobacter crassostrea]MBV7259919.1 GNAT family N-acetyltransferase [Erythrobacter crassostrea]